MTLDPPKTPDSRATTDVFSEVLEAASMETTFAAVTALHGAVGVALPGDLDAALHVVLHGRVFVAVEGKPAMALEEGCTLILPVDRPHSVADARGRRLLSVDDLPSLPPGLGIELRLGDGPARASVLTAAFRMKSRWTTGLLRVLPEAVVHGREEAARGWALATQLADEIRARAPGRDYLVRRYCEALLVEALRTEVTESRSAGLVGGMGDRALRLALEAIHRDCAREWTVEELARLSATSRSALAERFRRKIGVSPRQYLIDWRMHRASKLLGGTDLSVAEVAAATGYASEPAFSRTFKRATGVSPGRFRRARRG